MQGLNKLLSKPSQLYVLRTLFHAKEPLSGREIERRTGLSNRAAMLALGSLEEISAVTRETTSRAHAYELNQNNYLVSRGLRAAFEAEELFWDDLRKSIRKWVHPRPVAAVATGPLARDETLSDGRIDVVMVFSTGRNRVRAFPSTQLLQEEAWKRYALELTCHLVDINSANDAEFEPLWRRVEREGILLYGTLP